MKTGYTHMRCGLIGEHLGHSFSKIIHEKIADYSYDLVELELNEVECFVKSKQLDAFNVTIPYKKTVIPFLDGISDEAKRIGAVNTVVRRKDGLLYGYNTDYFGFSSMIDALGIDIKGKKAVILGSGGASLTVNAVLVDRGVREIVTVSRGGENNYENISKHFDADVIINATPIGMYPNNGKRLIDLDNFKNCKAVLDLIYNPANTALLLDAERLGIPHINGLFMLVSQAVKAFEFFTGDSAEDGIIDKISRQIEFDTKNIILVGMPASGKTTVGRLIAKELGRQFVDADEAFEQMHSVSPKDAILTLGEDEFRRMESITLSSICKESSLVIATGGGAVTRKCNYDTLRQNGTVIFLRRDLSLLCTENRPISQSRDLSELFAERRPYYESFSHLSIDSTEIPQKTAELIIEKTRSRIEEQNYGGKK